MLWNDDILKAEFEGYYKKATESLHDATQLVAITYAMIDALEKDNHAYEAEVHPSHMGIHPDNRSGKKMVGQSMQKKGSKVYTAGFTFKLCGPDKAIAFENEPNTNNCEKHTLSITAESEFFGDYKPNTIRAGSAGCKAG